MSTKSLRLLAVACWLLALVFAIVFAAGCEQYMLYRDGGQVEATVTGASTARGGKIQVDVRYPDEGRVVDDRVFVTGAVADYPAGRTLALLLHQNIRDPMLASDLDDLQPSPLWVLGVIASIGLGIYIWRAPNRAAKRRAGRTSALDPFIDAAVRTRNTNIGIAIFLIATAGFFSIIPLYDDSAGAAGGVVIWALAAVCVATAGYLLVIAYRLRDPRRNGIVELIEQRPDQIASYQVRRIVYKGQETLSLELQPRDGKIVRLSMVHEDLDAVLAELARRAPNAPRAPDR